MKALYIYNENDANEVALLDRARTELQNYITDIQVADFQTVKDIYQIAQTPALILIREDLQGTNLLDDISGQLRVTAELWQAIQQEELVIHQVTTYRIDNIILGEANAKQDALLEDMLTRGVI